MLAVRCLSLVTLICAPSLVSAATLSCASGLSKASLAAIIVESSVIAILVVVLIVVLRRQRRMSRLLSTNYNSSKDMPEYKREDEAESPRRPPSRTASVSEGSEADEFDSETRHLTLVPTLLRPRSVTLSSPPSVRSSTLYAFTPIKELSDPITMQEHQKVDGGLTAPVRNASLSSASLPNPHSEHGHGDNTSLSESPIDLLPPDAALAASTTPKSSQTEAPRSITVASSESSWADDVITSLSRGPTPLSRRSTVSSLLDDPGRYGNLHGLLMDRQKESHT